MNNLENKCKEHYTARLVLSQWLNVKKYRAMGCYECAGYEYTCSNYKPEEDLRNG